MSSLPATDDNDDDDDYEVEKDDGALPSPKPTRWSLHSSCKRPSDVGGWLSMVYTQGQFIFLLISKSPLSIVIIVSFHFLPLNINLTIIFSFGEFNFYDDLLSP